MKELGNRIIILSNGIKHYLHKAAEEEGISGAQSRILRFIAVRGSEGDIYQKDMEDFFLSQAFHCDPDSTDHG